MWYARVSSDPEFGMFIKIHPTIKPQRAWTVLKQIPELCENVKYVIDLCCMVWLEPYQLLCDKCGTFFHDLIEHLLVACDYVINDRDDLWRDIINISPIQFSVFLDNQARSCR